MFEHSIYDVTSGWWFQISSYFSQQVIDGTYEIPDGMNEYTVDFIALLKMPDLIRNKNK